MPDYGTLLFLRAPTLASSFYMGAWSVRARSPHRELWASQRCKCLDQPCNRSDEQRFDVEPVDRSASRLGRAEELRRKRKKDDAEEPETHPPDQRGDQQGDGDGDDRIAEVDQSSESCFAAPAFHLFSRHRWVIAALTPARPQQVDQPGQKLGLRRDQPWCGLGNCHPRGPIHLGKVLHDSRLGRPFHGKTITLDRLD